MKEGVMTEGEPSASSNERRNDDDDLNTYNKLVSDGQDPAKAHETIVQSQIARKREERFNDLITSGNYTTEEAAREMYSIQTPETDQTLIDQYNELVSNQGMSVENASAQIYGHVKATHDSAAEHEKLERYNDLIATGKMNPEQAASEIYGFSLQQDRENSRHERDTSTLSTARQRRASSGLNGLLTVHDSVQDEGELPGRAYDPSLNYTRSFIHDAYRSPEEETTVTVVSTDNFEKGRSFDEKVRIIGKNEVLRQFETLLPVGTARDSLLGSLEFTPTGGIEIDGKKFVFSDIFTGIGNYAQAILYEYENVRDARPRLYYKSNSDGGWRATPGYFGDRFSKGQPMGRPELGQYVQTTKPDENIVAYLESQMKRQDSNLKRLEYGSKEYITLIDAFSAERTTRDGYQTFSEEVRHRVVRGKGLDGYLSGYGFNPDREEGLWALMNMQLPAGFEPDFRNDPLQVYATEHTLVGKVAIEVYPAQIDDRDIEWHIARDKDGRLWIDRIEFADGKITSYGTRSEIILAGALSAKPFDYHSQADNMAYKGVYPDAIEFDSNYTDVTPLLKRLPPLRRYQEAKGLL